MVAGMDGDHTQTACVRVNEPTQLHAHAMRATRIPAMLCSSAPTTTSSLSRSAIQATTTNPPNPPIRCNPQQPHNPTNHHHPTHTPTVARFSAATRSDSASAVRTARDAIWVYLFQLGAEVSCRQVCRVHNVSKSITLCQHSLLSPRRSTHVIKSRQADMLMCFVVGKVSRCSSSKRLVAAEGEILRNAECGGLGSD